MRLNPLRLLTLCGMLLLTTLAFAAVPSMINYQGKLTKADGTLFPDTPTPYSLTFAIYSQSTGGLPLWSEINTNVQVKKGLFSVLLGSVNNLPANIFDGTDRYFGVTVGTDAEMSPRQQIASVPFALKAAVADKAIVADTVVDGSITKAKLAPDATGDINDALKTGWVPVTDIWTFKSVNQITTLVDVNFTFSVGDKIRFKQGGTYKYFYVIVIDNPTQLQLIGGSDYSISNSPITDVAYSKVSSPVGFPTKFMLAIDRYLMQMVGRTATVAGIASSSSSGEQQCNYGITFSETPFVIASRLMVLLF